MGISMDMDTDVYRWFMLPGSSSRDLALAICNLRFLKDLTIKGSYFHDDFYPTFASYAANSKVGISLSIKNRLARDLVLQYFPLKDILVKLF